MSHCWSGSFFPKHCGVVWCGVFPSDHPIQDLESGVAVPVLEMLNNRVYIYTDWFDNCHNGCVRSLRFCYKPVGDELMTIEIRNNGGGNGLQANHYCNC